MKLNIFGKMRSKKALEPREGMYMKTKLGLIITASLFLFSQAAHAIPLTVSATVPAATGLQLAVTPVNSTTNVFGTSSTTATTLPFGTLTLNSTLGIYLPTNYFAIDIGTTGGAGTPIVNVTYAEGTNPNGVATNGLGTKTTATFVTEAVSGTGTSGNIIVSGQEKTYRLDRNSGTIVNYPFRFI